MILKRNREIFARILFVLTIATAGCGRAGNTHALPDEGPEAVAKRFSD